MRLEHPPLVLLPLRLGGHEGVQDAVTQAQVRRVQEGHGAAAEAHAQLREEARLLRLHGLVEPPHGVQDCLARGHLCGALRQLVGQHRREVLLDLRDHDALQLARVGAGRHAVGLAGLGGRRAVVAPRLVLGKAARNPDLEEVAGQPGVLPGGQRLLAQQRRAGHELEHVHLLLAVPVLPQDVVEHEADLLRQLLPRLRCAVEALLALALEGGPLCGEDLPGLLVGDGGG
mmetsp:Transcript_12116/g.35994  ORF Transcript_12116/g.35994 Transcript_12116/m.35994 type:complete len:230 (-) Transcript_12116:2251-2940(-)